MARFTSPLAVETRVGAPQAQYAGAVAETAAGDWLVSARCRCRCAFALKFVETRFSLKSGPTALQTVLAQAAKILSSRWWSRHAQGPSVILLGCTIGATPIMMALDARQSREGDLKQTPASVRLETMDAQGHAVVTGTAPVETDGSFFVKLRPTSRFALPCSMKKARCCARSTDGSGFAAASSASAWVATRDRSAHRRIACRPCCCAPPRRLI